jgi:archaellum component FlaG (FlaF/FlaG flagellin family)
MVQLLRTGLLAGEVMARATIKKMIELEDQEDKSAEQLWQDFRAVAVTSDGQIKRAVPVALRLYILVRTLAKEFSFDTHTIKVVKRQGK